MTILVSDCAANEGAVSGGSAAEGRRPYFFSLPTDFDDIKIMYPVLNCFASGCRVSEYKSNRPCNSTGGTVLPVTIMTSLSFQQSRLLQHVMNLKNSFPLVCYFKIMFSSPLRSRPVETSFRIYSQFCKLSPHLCLPHLAAFNTMA